MQCNAANVYKINTLSSEFQILKIYNKQNIGYTFKYDKIITY